MPPKRPAPRPLAKKKAPWDTESFLNKIEGGSPGPAPLPEQLSEVPTFDPVPEPVELEPQTEPAEVEMALEPMEDVLEARVDDLFGSPMPSDDEDEKSTTFVAEYAVPTKVSLHHGRGVRPMFDIAYLWGRVGLKKMSLRSLPR